MCKYSGVLLSLIYLTSTLSANGFVIHGGFNAVFRRVVSSQTQSNVQSYSIQGLNSFYGSDYRDDLAEVERSIGRLLDPGRYSDEEFRFEKPAYNVTTTTNYIGLMTAFKLITSLKNTVQYGLLTDDAYVNQVFRIGPTTGLLYSDTKLKKGLYNFEITADIIDLQRHATANVTVNVTQPTPKISSAVEIYPILKISPNQKNQILEETGEEGSDSPQNYEKVTTERTEEFFSYIPYEFSRNVAKEDPKNPFNSLWRGLVQKNQRTNDRALNKEQLEKSLSTRPQIKLIVPHEHLRYQRAISRGVYAVSFDETSTTPADNATVTSIKIHEESLLVDHVMSSFILFVSTFGVVILLGSLVYFIYKRIKKCGDYSVDDDNNYKYVDGPLKKEIILRSDLKNPHFLCVNEINQKRVTDSIEITKSKLQGHPPSVFTIQKCYEDHQLQQTARRKSSSADDDVFIVDMSQMSTHSQDDDVYNTITLQSFTNSTPAITATLIGAPPPISILSSSRRSSIVSTKRDGSMNSEEMDPNGEMRRKSVTFSDIVELYQIKGAE